MERYLKTAAQKLENIDRAVLARESRELLRSMQRQLICQIPGLSAVGGILAGVWVSSTFTTSRLYGALASFGIIRGGTRVVSATAYGFLSILLPVVTAAVAAYAIQKALRAHREKKMRAYSAMVPSLDKEAQDGLKGKLAILASARAAGLLSEREYDTKTAGVYQACCGNTPSRFEEFIIKKIEG